MNFCTSKSQIDHRARGVNRSSSLAYEGFPTAIRHESSDATSERKCQPFTWQLTWGSASLKMPSPWTSRIRLLWKISLMGPASSHGLFHLIFWRSSACVNIRSSSGSQQEYTSQLYCYFFRDLSVFLFTHSKRLWTPIIAHDTDKPLPSQSEKICTYRYKNTTRIILLCFLIIAASRPRSLDNAR